MAIEPKIKRSNINNSCCTATAKQQKITIPTEPSRHTTISRHYQPHEIIEAPRYIISEMKKVRISHITPENATLITDLKQKIERISGKLKTDHQELRETPTKHPRGNTKRRVEKYEAAYAAPVPRRCLESLTAEENFHNWGVRRGLPIEEIKARAAQLRKPLKIRTTIRYSPSNAASATVPLRQQ